MRNAVRTPEMSVEEFYTFIDQHPDSRFDFIDGELVEVSLKPLHGRLQATLTYLLTEWAIKNEVGIVHTETLHVLNEEKFIPDISINLTTADGAPYFDTPPLLAVEIRSDTQSRAAQRRKAMQYINHGTGSVLLILPDENIELYTTNETQPQVYKPGDILHHVTELPGLYIDVKKLLS